jgi:hypothetical protein
MRGIIIDTNFKRINAIALFPFILTNDRSERTLNHERIHLAQELEMLVIPFYLWYGIEYLVYRLKGYSDYKAYRAISFEKEAFGNELDVDYLRKRKFWNFLKYL